MKRAKSRPTKSRTKSQLNKPQANIKLPFAEHIRELRKRLFYVALSVGIFSGAAYGVEHHIVAALLRPAKNQQFIYTSPGGGIDFLFRVCLYVGLAVSIPVIVYNILRYIEPLLEKSSTRFIAWGSIISGLFALAGIIFGYFVGLPAALNFLLHQFVTAQIRPLVTIQSYMNFVAMYMLGSALLFQVPLVMVFINRIKPLRPGPLFKKQKWMIGFSLIAAVIMNPNPNILSQLIVAVPMILMYYVGIGVIWYVNRNHKPKSLPSLLEKDAELQAQRQAQRTAARELTPVRPLAQAKPTPAAAVRPTLTPRPRPYANQFIPRGDLYRRPSMNDVM
jgi:sec-independent protein translocase protein TatC